MNLIEQMTRVNWASKGSVYYFVFVPPWRTDAWWLPITGCQSRNIHVNYNVPISFYHRHSSLLYLTVRFRPIYQTMSPIYVALGSRLPFFVVALHEQNSNFSYSIGWKKNILALLVVRRRTSSKIKLCTCTHKTLLKIKMSFFQNYWEKYTKFLHGTAF